MSTLTPLPTHRPLDRDYPTRATAAQLKSKGKRPRRDADFSSPAREVETSQFSAVPTQVSLIDERDLGDSTLEMLHQMEARMIAAECANAEKDVEIRSLTGRVLDLTNRPTAMMQQLFQDSPVEQAGGREQARARGLQPPAACSMRQQLQEGQQTRPEARQTPPARSRTRLVARQPPLTCSETRQVPQQPQQQQQQQQQQQPQQPAAPAKNKAWGKLP
ncbi:hypothetical protein BC830DRAFT_1172348 [Chytriomyces sp. MP71]|nr:hypothetical protein BC830DRAFT_1172348 [Chytriomyces sp. MP71]